MRDVTVVITSCGRLDLLFRTLDSFRKFNTYPIAQYILIEDSGNLNIAKDISVRYPRMRVIANIQNTGQVKSIDIAYSEVRTDYIFHLEDDWEFQQGGFIEKSMAILETDEKILTVWLRGLDDTNYHPVDRGTSYYVSTTTGEKVTDYYLMSVGALGGNWHGFTWNPGLRRTEDYKRIAPFSAFIEPNDFAALTECRIGQRYYADGFRAATLPEQYCKHIG